MVPVSHGEVLPTLQSPNSLAGFGKSGNILLLIPVEARCGRKAIRGWSPNMEASSWANLSHFHGHNIHLILSVRCRYWPLFCDAKTFVRAKLSGYPGKFFASSHVLWRVNKKKKIPFSELAHETQAPGPRHFVGWLALPLKNCLPSYPYVFRSEANFKEIGLSLVSVS